MNDVIVVDGNDLILGRLAAYVAKKALLGYTVEIVNAEGIIVTGSRKIVCNKYKILVNKGGPRFGITILRSPRGIFKLAVKRMLPHKKVRGREALARIKAYKGLPVRFKDQKLETIEHANVSKVPNLKYVTLQEISNFLGGK